MAPPPSTRAGSSGRGAPAPPGDAPLPGVPRPALLGHDVHGEGPPVLLIHGVAFGPWAFDAVAADLARDHRVVVVHRRGYGDSPAPCSRHRPEDQARELVALLDHLGLETVTALGVSGGATLLTALGMAAPERLDAAVLHEPALGPLAPGVHALLSGLARAVGSAASPSAGAEVVAAALAGPETWGMLGTAGRAEARRPAEAVCFEVPFFARFAPTAAELRALRPVPVVASVGERSGPERREAAGVLVRCAGAVCALVPGASNLAHIESPAALADVVRRAVPTAPTTATEEER